MKRVTATDAPDEPTAVPTAGMARTRPLRSASYLSAATLGAKAFSFIFVLYATRTLGVGPFGDYTFVLSFVGLFGVLTDLGMGTLAVRDVAQNRSLATRYVSNILGVRLACALVAVALIVALAQVPGLVAPSLRNSLYVYALALVPLAVSNTLGLAFQFFERMEYSALFNVATSAVMAFIGIMILFLGHRVLGLVAVFTLVTTASTVVMAMIVYKRFLPPRLALDFSWWPTLLRQAAPFVALTLLSVLYFRADIVLLTVLSHCSQAGQCVPTGLYGAAYRLLDILIIVFAVSLSTATLPAFNRVVTESRQELARLVHSSSVLMLAFGVPTALLAAFYAPEALHILAGKSYIVAAPALAVLIWAFPCFLLTGVLYNALYALHLQRIVATAFAVTLCFNVTFNLLLIPQYSFFASSVLTVGSEIFNLAIVTLAVQRHVGSLDLSGTVVKVGGIAIVTGVALWSLRSYGIFVGLPVGVVIMVLGVRLTRLFGQTEHAILERLPLMGRYTKFV